MIILKLKLILDRKQKRQIFFLSCIRDDLLPPQDTTLDHFGNVAK
jgi:hypothetical protein